MRRKMEKPNMVPVTRRHFVRQAAFAAAFYRCPFKAIDEAQRVFNADEQNVARWMRRRSASCVLALSAM
jgi:hypothetical protein